MTYIPQFLATALCLCIYTLHVVYIYLSICSRTFLALYTSPLWPSKPSIYFWPILSRFFTRATIFGIGIWDLRGCVVHGHASCSIHGVTRSDNSSWSTPDMVSRFQVIWNSGCPSWAYCTVEAVSRADLPQPLTLRMREHRVNEIITLEEI